jgi:high-affinity Fe2+/Pb2+ permease
VSECPPEPKPRGRGHLFEPTDKERLQVELMVAGGITQDDICLALDIAKKTLAKHFKAELERGSAKVHAKLASSALAMALAGDKTMMIFVLKTRFGWRDKGGDDSEQKGTVTIILNGDSAKL